MLDFGGGPDLEAAGRRAVAVRRLRPLMEAELEERGGAELFHDMELPLVGSAGPDGGGRHMRGP